MKFSEGDFSFGTVIIHFWDKTYHKINFKSHLKCTTLYIRKNTVRFAHSSFNFISLYLLMLTFAMKLKDAYYKNHWNILVLCDQWKMMSDLNMNHERMSDFISFSLFGFTLAIKLRNFEKDMVSDLAMPHGKMSDFVSFRFFRFALAIKLRNFNFESH